MKTYQKKKTVFKYSNKYSSILKIVSVFFVLLFSLSSVTAIAQAKSTEVLVEAKLVKSIVITDEAELNKIIQRDGMVLAGTKKLDKVEIFVYAAERETPSVQDSSIEVQGIVYEIKNVVETNPEFYYTSDYSHDTCYGSGTFATTYTFDRAVKTDFGGVSIGNSTVSSAVGYKITDTYTVSRYFTATIAEGKALDVKAYPSYRRTTFDIYNKWNNTLVKKGAHTDKPVGVTIVKYTYST